MQQTSKSTLALPAGAKLRGGDYVIDSVLGTGGFGITYLASEPLLERFVAIKEFFPTGCRRQETALTTDGDWTSELLEDFRRSFLREGRLLARLSHPGIVPIFSVFEENRTAYLVMDHIEGRTLRDYLSAQKGRLPVAEAVELVRQAAEALGVIHSQGLLHRDLKPANMMLRPDRRLILIDFGSAREISPDRRKHTSLLTHGYAPFEQYDDYGVFGPPTDIYALAAVLYHLITGNLPLNAISRRNGMPLPSPRDIQDDVPAHISVAVMRALEMEPEKRPQHAHEFIELLASVKPEIDEKPRPIQPEVTERIEQSALRDGSKPPQVRSRIGGGSDERAPHYAQVLSGHQRPVDCVAWSPDGGSLVSVGRDNALRTWDASTGEARTVLFAQGAANSACFSPDGMYIASGSQNLEVLIWDASNGIIEWRLAGHSKPVFSVAWSAKSGWIATGSADRTARIWDVGTGDTLAALSGHKDRVTSVSWNSQGSMLATAGDDRTVRVFNASEGDLLHTLQGRMSAVSSVCWSPDDSSIAATGHSSGTEWIWDVEGEWLEYELAIKPDNPQFAVYSSSWRPGEAEIAFGCQDGSVQIWHTKTAVALHILREHAGPVRSVAWSPDGKRLASCGNDQTIRIWEIP